MSQIDVKRVSFRHGGNLILKDISLHVNKGDFIGLIGPNGSGKSTLLKLILGIYKNQEGEIKIFGKEMERSDRSRIGYVPQKPASFGADFPASVREVVGMGLLSKKRFPKLITEEDEKRIRKTLSIVGLKEIVDRRIGALSGGQQQRVLIAQALISDPDILILDEPTTGVDQDTQERFYDLLGKLNKRGISIILVTHDTGRVTRHVTKIAFLNQRLEFFGTHGDFCSNDEKHRFGHTHHICLVRE